MVKDSGWFEARVPASLAPLIERYTARRRKDVLALRAAIDSKDFVTVSTLGHSMKGSGGGYGFHAVTEIGAVLERAGDEGDEVTAREMLVDLEEYLDHVRVSIESSDE